MIDQTHDAGAGDFDKNLKLVKREMKFGRFREAVAITSKLEPWQNNRPEVRYVRAVCYRYLKDFEAATGELQLLTQRSPSYSRAYQEEGHLFRAQGKTRTALFAYKKAVSLNPALIASWKAIVSLNDGLLSAAEIKEAKSQFDRLNGLPPVLVSVGRQTIDGELWKAEQQCRAFLKHSPLNVEAMRLLADLGVRLYIYDDAEYLLESCLEFSPDFQLARFDYVNVLQKRQKFELALAQARILYASDPQKPGFMMALANAELSLGKTDQALELYNKILDHSPNHTQTLLTKGHALKTAGDQDKAISSYRRASKSSRGFGDAYWSLANLKTYRFTTNEIEKMLEHDGDPRNSIEDKYHLCFALGKANEDLKDFDRAFSYYERGNLQKVKQLQYSAARMDVEIDAQISACDRKLFGQHSGSGCEKSDPIFIVGLPRSGSTLLEQILASHSQVDGTLELPNVLALAHRLNGRRRLDEESAYPGNLVDLCNTDLKQFGEEYIASTRIFRMGASHFIDKMPNNFRHIGLIHCMLPNAKIIDARRNPMACCFSGFKQLFAEGQEFSYGLSDIGRYYSRYVDLMNHWDAVLPGKILRVQYEDIVADMQGQVRRMLGFLNLPFEKGCLEFYKSDRSVRTASSEQVRQPIFKSGLDHWRNFESHLGPLRKALGQNCETENA